MALNAKGIAGKRVAGLQAWQWAALAGVVGAYILYQRHKAAAGSGQTLDTSQLGNAAAQLGLPGAQGPAGVPGAPGKPVPKPPPSPHPASPPLPSSWQQWARFLQWNSPTTPRMIDLGVAGHQGYNVRGGAPVYALVGTRFGPIFEQFYGAVPAGTHVYTPAVFRSQVIRAH